MIGKRSSIWTAMKQARHDREMKRHVALVAGAEVGDGILRPLVRFGQQHAVLVFFVDMLPELLQKDVGLRKILTVGALALVEIGHGVQAHAVHAHLQPEIQDR